MNSRSKFDKVKYDARAYAEAYGGGSAPLRTVLNGAVEMYGSGIFLEPASLSAAMHSLGADESDILKVCLMTRVPGFRRLIEGGSGTEQIDLDRYVMNAEEKTGFTRDNVLWLTFCIVDAAGIWMDYLPMPEDDAARASAEGLREQLCSAMFSARLGEFEEKMDKLIFEDDPEVKLDFKKLEPLVNMGIPRAKYLLGYCLLHGIQLQRNEKRGVSLLREAAEAGEGDASAALGDYHYDRRGVRDWSMAYRYYTGYGAVALNPSRRVALVNILNQRLYNRKNLILCSVLLAATVLFMALIPAPGSSGAHSVMGVLVVVLQAGLLAFGVVRFRLRPFDRLYVLPISMAALWFAYAAAGFFF